MGQGHRSGAIKLPQLNAIALSGKRIGTVGGSPSMRGGDYRGSMVTMWLRAMLVGALMTAGGTAAAAPERLIALDTVQPGEWELRPLEKDGGKRRLCVRDPRQLLRTEHARHQCRLFVVKDGPAAASVTYDCAQAGGGRTDVRVETPRLVQIRSQGVADGAPFARVMEARRLGACR